MAVGASVEPDRYLQTIQLKLQHINVQYMYIETVLFHTG